jgi:hypothetical protein
VRWAARLTAALVCPLVMAAMAGSALASTVPGLPGQAAPGHTRLGVGSEHPTRFDRLTGHHHDVWLRFALLGGSWTRYRMIASWINKAADQHRIAMITLSATPAVTRRPLWPRAIARGRADAYFIDYSRQANGTGEVVWFRPWQEMNGYWSSMCAYNANGTRRAGHSPRNFRRAFRRVAVILRGGTKAQINAKLVTAHLPKLQSRLGSRGIVPSGKVAMVWNPQGTGAPDVRGNQPINYYPGKRYVDYVADDMYEIGGRAYWRGMHLLYSYGKPFVLGEYAPWGNDDPAFVSKVLDWPRTHPRTAALVYFQFSRPAFRLSSKPRSLKAYRTLATRQMFHTTI